MPFTKMRSSVAHLAESLGQSELVFPEQGMASDGVPDSAGIGIFAGQQPRTRRGARRARMVVCELDRVRTFCQLV